ncbi:MAG TPA: hypothetical protein VD948_04090 [Rhodothermales bacterium]|nr:hypothetical protein [Rhodothermales bacterium]
MPYLNVGGSTIPVAAEGGARKSWVEVGDRSRGTDGSVLQTIRSRPRVWRIKTVAMSSSDAVTLATSLSCTPPQTAYGTLMPSTATSVYPELVGQTFVAAGTGPRVVTEFLLHESS